MPVDATPRPSDAPGAASANAAALPLGPELQLLQRAIAESVGEGPKDAVWLLQLMETADRCVLLLQRDRDSVLYLLAQDAQRRLQAYSARHALFCAFVCMLCAEQLDWTEPEVVLLTRAALTMNLGMTALQDELSLRERIPTLEQRQRIDEHPKRSADLLRASGVDDPAWLGVVEGHHDDPSADVGLSALSPTQRLSALLHRVDVFTAKVSARKTRDALPATAAARDACLGPGGQPDKLGAAVIKALGIYPPGTYVKLANGEVAVVRRRGEKANAPLVLSLIGSDGRPLAVPVPRHTGQTEQAILSVVRPIHARAVADHLRLGSLVA